MPSLKSLMTPGDYQAYTRAIRSHGRDTASPPRHPGLMTTGRELLALIEEAKGMKRQEVMRQSGMQLLHDQACHNHTEQMAAHEKTRAAIGSSGSTIEFAVQAGVSSVLGHHALTADQSADEKISMLAGRRKSGASLLHQLKKEKAGRGHIARRRPRRAMQFEHRRPRPQLGKTSFHCICSLHCQRRFFRVAVRLLAAFAQSAQFETPQRKHRHIVSLKVGGGVVL